MIVPDWKTPRRPEREEELVLPVNYLLRAVRRKLWLILLVVILCVGLTAIYTTWQTPLYTAYIKILVGQERGIVADPAQTMNLQSLTATMSEAVATRPVAEGAVKRLGLRQSPEYVLANMSAEPLEDTQFIEVSYTDTDPERAQRIANAIGDEFSKRVAELSANATSVSVTVWERATFPEGPTSPNPVRSGLLGLMLGGTLGTGLAFLLEFRDNSWRSPEEVEQVSGVPTLAAIPRSDRVWGSKVKEKS